MCSVALQLQMAGGLQVAAGSQRSEGVLYWGALMHACTAAHRLALGGCGRQLAAVGQWCCGGLWDGGEVDARSGETCKPCTRS